MSKLALVASAVICTCIAALSLSEDECQTFDDHCVGGYASLLQESIRLIAPHKQTATSSANEARRARARAYKDYVLKLPKMPTDAAQSFTPDLNEICTNGITNPSIITLPQLGEVWVVQRSLKKCFHFLLSKNVIAQKLSFRDFHGRGYSWYSHVVFARAALTNLGINANTSWDWKQYAKVPDPRLEGGNVTTCLDPVYTADGTYSEGLEDPRLFSYGGKNFIMVIGGEVVQSPPDGTVIPHAGQSNLSSQARLRSKTRPECKNFGPQPYIAEIESVHPTIKFGPLVHLASPDKRWSDKNWSPFTWTPAGREPRLMMVYQVHPHAILQVNASTGITQKVFSEVSPAVTAMALKANINASQLHGGSGVARIENFGHPYNLAVMHVHGPSRFPDLLHEDVYRNWPYKFSTEPPFNIVAVGRELPFAAGAGINFVCSVTSHNNTIIIGYGWGDREARLWEMGLNEFESTFF